ncbi:MAG: putative sugar O-methyltransferase, partial [Acidisphaera sp.]|nr:putative sugar O-methyltransferase [Acidisphaera sp.]
DTGRGIQTYRATQALYQAWQLKKITGDTVAPKVLEIGAGSGRTAYYAWRLGIRDYTIVDLPLTCVASANFLGRTLGPEHLKLYGEDGAGSISIVPPETFFKSRERFDVALNVDSLTEMARETAEAYFDEIDERSYVFLSINHEWNLFRVRDLFTGRRHARHACMMRAGYAEEVVETLRGRARYTGLGGAWRGLLRAMRGRTARTRTER